MASRGDVQEQIFFATSTALPVSNVPDLPEGLKECCYELLILVDTDALTDPLRNDQTSYFKFYPQSFTAATFEIQKCEGGVFVTKHTISDNTYGTFKDYEEEVKNNLNYISIKNILWSAVKASFGVGEYRIQAGALDLFGNVIVDYSFTYNVTNYTDEAADNTVFIKIHNEGLLGDINKSNKERFVFPDEWQDGIRIRGLFEGAGSDYEEEHTRLNDGFEQYTEHRQVPKYLLLVDRAPQSILNFLRNEVLMANRIFMTNYNTNSDCYVEEEVRRSGSFDLERIKRVSKAKVPIEFVSAYDNTYKTHCTI